MAAKKKTQAKRAKKIAGVVVAPKARGKNLSSGVFKPDNPYAFKPGQSGNPGGKPKGETRLLSKAMRVQLSWRAPNEVALQLGLPTGSSWAQCISMRLIRLAIRDGDVSAMRELREATEGTRQRFEIFDDDGNPQETPPLITVVFQDSDGNGRPASSSMIEGKSAAAHTLPSDSD